MLPWIRFMFEIVRFLLRMGLESIETFAESDGCKLLISLFFYRFYCGCTRCASPSYKLFWEVYARRNLCCIEIYDFIVLVLNSNCLGRREIWHELYRIYRVIIIFFFFFVNLDYRFFEIDIIIIEKQNRFSNNILYALIWYLWKKGILLLARIIKMCPSGEENEN